MVTLLGCFYMFCDISILIPQIVQYWSFPYGAKRCESGFMERMGLEPGMFELGISTIT